MRPREKLLDRIATGLFRAGGGPQKTPHPLFLDLYQRLHAALDEAEICLHSELTSRPNRVEIFFDFRSWSELVAAREAQVYRAVEAEIEAHRLRAGYAEEERVVLRLFVADPAQHEVPPNRPEVLARRVPDPLAMDQRWSAALRHDTIVGGRPRAPQSLPEAPPLEVLPPPPLPPAQLPTRATPLAVVCFTDDGGERRHLIHGPGALGRSAECELRVEGGAGPLEIVSRRALYFDSCPHTATLLVENLGRWALRQGGGAALEPGASLRVERQAELTWPGDQGDGFRVEITAPRRGTLRLAGPGGEQAVVLRSPRTRVQADPSLFGELDLCFHVDFVDGTRFLVLNNEGTVPLRLGSLEGKQLQWPIDAPRPLEAGPLSISIELEEER